MVESLELLPRSVLRHAPLKDKHEAIIELCRGKSVLDVGCVGQAFGAESPEWLHGKLAKVCRELYGTDVDAQAVTALQAKGFPVYLYEQLVARGKHFDVIVIADVIEHVGNPQEFIETYVELLRRDGVLVISTPNAVRLKESISILVSGNYGVHNEHTMWFCPRTLSELGRRCALDVQQLIWLREHKALESNTSIKSRLVRKITDILCYASRLYSPNFLLIFARR